LKSFVENAFDKLATQHRQEAFFKEHGEFVSPEELIDENDGSVIGCVVPIEPKLKSLLEANENRQFGESDHNILRSKNIKCYLNDGVYIQDAIRRLTLRLQLQEPVQNAKHSDTILYFALYYDDIEIVNAIGSSRKKHKLGNARILKNSEYNL